MTSFLLRDDTDLQRLRAFFKQLPHGSNMGDFEEQIQLPAVRVTTRLWQRADELVACAYVDGGNNLRFEIEAENDSDQLEQEIVDWGLACMRQRNAQTGNESTLDACCNANDVEQLHFFEKFGFVRETIRSLKYSRSLAGPIDEFPFPSGFSLRSVTGESEVEALVALHRAAFGTDNMTVEERLAIMRAPQYVPDLDLVAVAPNGDLSAFCICGFEEDDEQIGFTDPLARIQTIRDSAWAKPSSARGCAPSNPAGQPSQKSARAVRTSPCKNWPNGWASPAFRKAFGFQKRSRDRYRL